MRAREDVGFWCGTVWMTILVVGSDAFEGTADAKKRKRQYNTSDNNKFDRDRRKKTNVCRHSTNLSRSDLGSLGV